VKQFSTLALSVALAVLLLIALPTLSHAQSSSYDLTWSTVDNGGGTSVGGSYTLNGTIGQAEAGVASRGGGYALVGGFWGGEGGSVYHIYLPLVLCNS
jgi:hypothetical protein